MTSPQQNSPSLFRARFKRLLADKFKVDFPSKSFPVLKQENVIPVKTTPRWSCYTPLIEPQMFELIQSDDGKTEIQPAQKRIKLSDKQASKFDVSTNRQTLSKIFSSNTLQNNRLPFFLRKQKAKKKQISSSLSNGASLSQTRLQKDKVILQKAFHFKESSKKFVLSSIENTCDSHKSNDNDLRTFKFSHPEILLSQILSKKDKSVINSLNIGNFQFSIQTNICKLNDSNKKQRCNEVDTEISMLRDSPFSVIDQLKKCHVCRHLSHSQQEFCSLCKREFSNKNDKSSYIFSEPEVFDLNMEQSNLNLKKTQNFFQFSNSSSDFFNDDKNVLSKYKKHEIKIKSHIQDLESDEEFQHFKAGVLLKFRQLYSQKQARLMKKEGRASKFSKKSDITSKVSNPFEKTQINESEKTLPKLETNSIQLPKLEPNSLNSKSLFNNLIVSSEEKSSSKTDFSFKQLNNTLLKSDVQSQKDDAQSTIPQFTFKLKKSSVSKNPESKDPESKDPESNGSESKDSESKDSDSKGEPIKSLFTSSTSDSNQNFFKTDLFSSKPSDNLDKKTEPLNSFVFGSNLKNSEQKDQQKTENSLAEKPKNIFDTSLTVPPVFGSIDKSKQFTGAGVTFGSNLSNTEDKKQEVNKPIFTFGSSATNILEKKPAIQNPFVFNSNSNKDKKQDQEKTGFDFGSVAKKAQNVDFVFGKTSSNSLIPQVKPQEKQPFTFSFAPSTSVNIFGNASSNLKEPEKPSNFVFGNVNKDLPSSSASPFTFNKITEIKNVPSNSTTGFQFASVTTPTNFSFSSSTRPSLPQPAAAVSNVPFNFAPQPQVAPSNVSFEFGKSQTTEAKSDNVGFIFGAKTNLRTNPLDSAFNFAKKPAVEAAPFSFQAKGQENQPLNNTNSSSVPFSFGNAVNQTNNNNANNIFGTNPSKKLINNQSTALNAPINNVFAPKNSSVGFNFGAPQMSNLNFNFTSQPVNFQASATTLSSLTNSAQQPTQQQSNVSQQTFTTSEGSERKVIRARRRHG